MRQGRRWLGFGLLLACVFSLAACLGPRKQERIRTAEMHKSEANRIEGVTTTKGEEFEFDNFGVLQTAAISGKVKGAQTEVPLDQVQRVWVSRREISEGRTVALTVGVAATLVLAAAITLAATGCPYLYSWDGEKFVLDAELFGGSISQGLERQDFAELPGLRASAGTYRLLLADELDETDYTDSLELIVVDHAQGSRVGIDDNGGLHSLNRPMTALEAHDDTGADLRPWLASPDHRVWEAEPAQLSGVPLRRTITLTFPKPAGAESVRLAVRAGTAQWGVQMFNKIFSLYGRDLNGMLDSLDDNRLEANSVLAWTRREDLFTLNVWVREAAGWKVRGVIPGGWMGSKVIPLDLSGVTGNTVQIQLRPPGGFWAIDSMTMDFGVDQPLRVTRLQPATARTDSGAEVTDQLRQTDGKYYQASQGDKAEITFNAPPATPGMSRTVFLSSRGYYRPNMHSTAPADTATLLRIFTVPDGMARFAAEQFAALRLKTITH